MPVIWEENYEVGKEYASHKCIDRAGLALDQWYRSKYQGRGYMTVVMPLRVVICMPSNRIEIYSPDALAYINNIESYVEAIVDYNITPIVRASTGDSKISLARDSLVQCMNKGWSVSDSDKLIRIYQEMIPVMKELELTPFRYSVFYILSRRLSAMDLLDIVLGDENG